jgi:uncharacterized protein YjbI with pentapeptide repeats
MDNFVPRPLTHNDLNRMMLEHNNYRSSGGKEGQILNLTSYVVEDFNFSKQDLSGIDAYNSVFIRCKFTGCNLAYSHFSGSEFTDVDFSDAVFVKAELYDVKAEKTCFDRANLRCAEFMSAKLVDVSFRNADLGGGILSDSELTRTIFDGSNFGGAAVSDNQETDASWINVNGKRDTSQIAS